jgi:hypothetical protein
MTDSGGKHSMPVFCAMLPVRNGKSALPACPKAAIHPIEGGSNQGGMIRAAKFIAIGYHGPKTNPRKAAAIPLPVTDGTNQMTNPRLFYQLASIRMPGLTHTRERGQSKKRLLDALRPSVIYL